MDRNIELPDTPDNLRMRNFSVLLIGAGGNGSEMFDGLVRLDAALRAFGHDGLNVSVIDDDIVSPSNIVRQRFWPHEIGLHKSIALVNRVNMLLGLDWHAQTSRFDINYKGVCNYDLVVTAVDNLTTRACVGHLLAKSSTLWMDLGCSKSQGQVILGAGHDISLNSRIPNVLAHYPELLTESEPLNINTPSCSSEESLRKQDLMINSAIGNAATNLLFQSIRSGKIPYNGVVIDLIEGWSQSIPFIRQAVSASA